MLKDITAPYSAVESWLYDRLVAPAVQPLHRALAAEFLARVSEGASVLEVGCGGGHFALLAVAERRSLTWTGVDLSKEQVERAGRRAAGIPKLKFLAGDALALPFEGRSFDAVVSIASLKHWPDRGRGLRECARVLRPGGVLFIAEADRASSPEEQDRFVSMLRLPRFFRPGFRAVFRRAIAGRSVDLAGARALLSGVALAENQVQRMAGMPLWIMTGRA